MASTPPLEELALLPEYSYTPLRPGEFRIVHLHAGEEADPIIVSVEVVDTFHHCANAVSYVWGDNERVHRIYAGKAIITHVPDSITIHMAPSEKLSGYMLVTDNLRQLLQAVRSKDSYIPLWVDSMCINQNDIAEKTSQVQQMTSFYGVASCTIIYLGEHDRTMQMAFVAIQVLAAMANWETEKLPRFLSSGWPTTLRHKEMIYKNYPPRIGPETWQEHDPWEAFMAFLRLPWFHRMWIMQEVVISRNPVIVTSSSILSWDTLLEACRVVERGNMHEVDAGRVHINIPLHLEMQRQSLRNFITASEKGPVPDDSELMREMVEKNHFLVLQVRTRGCRATDPRDHVFAILGIAKGGGDYLPKADYSLSLVEVYVRISYAWYKNQNRRPLTWLSCVNGSYDAADLPSWAPDWRRSWDILPLYASVQDGGGVSGAEGKKRCMVEFPPLKTPMVLPLRIRIRGCQILRVKDVELVKSTSWEQGRHAQIINTFPEPYPTTYLTYADAFLKSVTLGLPINPDLEIPRHESFWSYRRATPARPRPRPVFGRDADKFRGPAISLIVRFHEGQAKPSIYTMNNGSKRSKNEPQYSQRYFYQELPSSYCIKYTVPQDKFVRSRKWFITEDGFMGLAHEITEPGDIIVYLFGGEVLYVLRKRREEANETIWGLVGECFVLGLMNGELNDGMPEESVEDFVIE
ncbi:hypothetical protein G7046_g4351 [Stylonectria norvegica]|nr:hypothetical protein G7046_g4351 [Stylonectria norvegica]